MSVMDHTSNILAGLTREFPLVARLEQLPPDVRQTYGAVVAEWYARGAAPQPDRFDPQHLAALEKSDAIVLTQRGIGCYPFSATPTSMRVRYLDRLCHAMCAIDALAIPCILGIPADIDAACSVCQQSLSIRVNPASGAPSRGLKDTAITHSGVAVLYTPSSAEHEVCCRQLCPSIVFVCEDCVPIGDASPLSIAAATVVGSEFFAFQRAYLRRPSTASAVTPLVARGQEPHPQS
jgi:hypothetical protein